MGRMYTNKYLFLIKRFVQINFKRYIHGDLYVYLFFIYLLFVIK